MMTPVAHLSLIQARRLALRSLTSELQAHSVPEVVRRLGYVQIDTIAVIARAHHHVLWTRLPTYDAAQLDRAQSEERQVLEYWSHAAAYLPMEDYRFCLPRMAASRRRRDAWFRAHKPLTQHVLQRIRTEGPLRAADFEAEPGHHAGPWWDWKPAKLALEYLFHAGHLLVTYRRGFQKYFDLAERVLPPHVNTTRPTPLAYGRHLIRRTLECHGLATEKEITYLKPYAHTAVRQAVQAMTKQGALLPVTVEGLHEVYFVQPDHLEQTLTTPPDSAQTAATVRLLSPFDNLVIQRKRLQQLFGFPYQIECYVPAAKRQYGYFCLPILWGERFVGRVDPKAHRSTRCLELLSLSVDRELQGTRISGPRSRRRCRLLPHLMGVRPSPGPTLTGVCVGATMALGFAREASHAYHEVGTLTLEHLLRTYADHGKAHLRQISQTLAAGGMSRCAEHERQVSQD